MRWLMLAALLWLTPHPARAQCCGDCAGDGEVTIDDLIVAVNHALLGCAATTPTPGGATPTPTGSPAGACPINFQDDNTQPGTPDCYYRGAWNQTCGAADLEILWRSDSDILIISLLGFDSGLFLGAEASGPSSADVFCWYTQDDASDCDQHPISGTATLSSNGGTLTIVPQTPPFDIENCPFADYNGTLFNVDTPAAARASQGAARVPPALLQRLHASAPPRSHGANFQRHSPAGIHVD